MAIKVAHKKFYKCDKFHIQYIIYRIRTIYTIDICIYDIYMCVCTSNNRICIINCVGFAPLALRLDSRLASFFQARKTSFTWEINKKERETHGERRREWEFQQNSKRCVKIYEIRGILLPKGH